MGLGRFSARAEAVNFSPRDLEEIVNFAHSLQPKRKVYVALNTLVKNAEISGFKDNAMLAAEAGVDAVIVQDLGAARLLRRHFPNLTLHGSTQMAIHNLDGALALKDLGYSRVTLARELTLDEIRTIVGSGLEVEVFIHGALCYSYSGLCLFSSLETGRSGNRGRCSYPCRELCHAEGEDISGHAFSLMDLALGPRVRDLANAGVKSCKIEGRKKSPLYVAATVSYYRRLLDGTISASEIKESEAELQTIFARPWTHYFLDRQHGGKVADPDVIGHRGAPMGKVIEAHLTSGQKWLRFTTALPIERHDGIQADIEGEEKPYGFPVRELRLFGRSVNTSAFAVSAGETVEVALPEDAPFLEKGTQLYLASSQAVKRKFPYPVPKPGLFVTRHNLSITVGMTSGAVVVRLSAIPPAVWGTIDPVSLVMTVQIAAEPAKDATIAEAMARQAFSKLGDTCFALSKWVFENSASLFLPPKAWNAIRRDAVAQFTEAWEHARTTALRKLGASAVTINEPSRSAAVSPAWSIVIDRPEYVATFQAEDWDNVDEVIVGLQDDQNFERALDSVEQTSGKKPRIHIPIVYRDQMVGRINDSIRRLSANGRNKWLLSGLAPWYAVHGQNMDLAADWPLYALNNASVEFLAEMGIHGFTLSPEDDRNNLSSILPIYGDQAWIIAYGHVPLFISASCAHYNVGACQTCGNCGKPMHLHMTHGKEVLAIPSGCGSVVIGSRPINLTRRLSDLTTMGARRLRADFRWRSYDPAEVRSLWRQLRSGTLDAGFEGNYARELI